jgi:hypothetical protein
LRKLSKETRTHPSELVFIGKKALNKLEETSKKSGYSTIKLIQPGIEIYPQNKLLRPMIFC